MAAPLIDNRSIPNPIRVRCGEPASITIKVSGTPKPQVRWQIGRRRVKDSAKYQIKTDIGGSHTLVVSKVTEDLEQGVWVVASNDVGEDCCLVEIKIISNSGTSRENPNHSSFIPNQNQDPGVGDVPKIKTGLKKKKPRKLGDTQSVTSLDVWDTNANGSVGAPSLDDVTDQPSTQEDWNPGQDLNQSFDPSVANRRSTRPKIKSKRQRFNSTDAIFVPKDQTLPLQTGKKSNAAVIIDTINMFPAINPQGLETQQPNKEKVKKVRKVNSRSSVADTDEMSLVRDDQVGQVDPSVVDKPQKKVKKKPGSRTSSLASIHADHSDTVFPEQPPADPASRQVEHSEVEPSVDVPKKEVKKVKRKPGSRSSSVASIDNPEAAVPERPADVGDQQTKVGSKAKSIKAKALPKSPAFGNEDTELLWELFGMRLNVLCRNLLKELVDNMERPSTYIGTVDKVEELVDNVERPSTYIGTDDEVEELVENVERPSTYIGTVDKVEEFVENMETPSMYIIGANDKVEELVVNMERLSTYIGAVDESKENPPGDSKINHAATNIEPENFSTVEEKDAFDSPAETKINTNKQERTFDEIEETEKVQPIKPRKQKPPRKNIANKAGKPVGDPSIRTHGSVDDEASIGIDKNMNECGSVTNGNEIRNGNEIPNNNTRNGNNDQHEAATKSGEEDDLYSRNEKNYLKQTTENNCENGPRIPKKKKKEKSQRPEEITVDLKPVDNLIHDIEKEKENIVLYLKSVPEPELHSGDARVDALVPSCSDNSLVLNEQTSQEQFEGNPEVSETGDNLVTSVTSDKTTNDQLSPTEIESCKDDGDLNRESFSAQSTQQKTDVTNGKNGAIDETKEDDTRGVNSHDGVYEGVNEAEGETSILLTVLEDTVIRDSINKPFGWEEEEDGHHIRKPPSGKKNIPSEHPSRSESDLLLVVKISDHSSDMVKSDHQEIDESSDRTRTPKTKKVTGSIPFDVDLTFEKQTNERNIAPPPLPGNEVVKPASLTTYIVHKRNLSRSEMEDHCKSHAISTSTTDLNNLSEPPTKEDPNRSRGKNVDESRQRSRSAGLTNRSRDSTDLNRSIVLIDINIDKSTPWSPTEEGAQFTTNLYRAASGNLEESSRRTSWKRLSSGCADSVQKTSLKPARSEEILVAKSPSRSRKSSTKEYKQSMRNAKSVEFLGDGSESSFSSKMGKRTLSREWNVVTVTTKEEIFILKSKDVKIEEKTEIKTSDAVKSKEECTPSENTENNNKEKYEELKTDDEKNSKEVAREKPAEVKEDERNKEEPIVDANKDEDKKENDEEMKKDEVFSNTEEVKIKKADDIEPKRTFVSSLSVSIERKISSTVCDIETETEKIETVKCKQDMCTQTDESSIEDTKPPGNMCTQTDETCLKDTKPSETSSMSTNTEPQDEQLPNDAVQSTPEEKSERDVTVTPILYEYAEMISFTYDDREEKGEATKPKTRKTDAGITRSFEILSHERDRTEMFHSVSTGDQSEEAGTGNENFARSRGFKSDACEPSNSNVNRGDDLFDNNTDIDKQVVNDEKQSQKGIRKNNGRDRDEDKDDKDDERDKDDEMCKYDEMSKYDDTDIDEELDKIYMNRNFIRKENKGFEITDGPILKNQRPNKDDESAENDDPIDDVKWEINPEIVQTENVQTEHRIEDKPRIHVPVEDIQGQEITKAEIWLPLEGELRLHQTENIQKSHNIENKSRIQIPVEEVVESMAPESKKENLRKNEDVEVENLMSTDPDFEMDFDSDDSLDEELDDVNVRRIHRHTRDDPQQAENRIGPSDAAGKKDDECDESDEDLQQSQVSCDTVIDVKTDKREKVQSTPTARPEPSTPFVWQYLHRQSQGFLDSMQRSATTPSPRSSDTKPDDRETDGDTDDDDFSETIEEFDVDSDTQTARHASNLSISHDIPSREPARPQPFHNSHIDPLAEKAYFHNALSSLGELYSRPNHHDQ